METKCRCASRSGAGDPAFDRCKLGCMVRTGKTISNEGNNSYSANSYSAGHHPDSGALFVSRSPSFHPAQKSFKAPPYPLFTPYTVPPEASG